MMNHDHHNHCAHNSLAYCAPCQVAYCKNCSKQWGPYNFMWSNAPTLPNPYRLMATGTYSDTTNHTAHTTAT